MISASKACTAVPRSAPADADNANTCAPVSTLRSVPEGVRAGKRAGQ